MKKIILFFPETHGRRSDDPWCLPPLALLAIAAPLIRDGYQVKIIDSRVDGLSLPAILAEATDALCLGISVLTGRQIEEALLVSREVKRHLPALPVVWGGYHPTLLPAQTIAEPSVDILVTGQGEVTFKMLADALTMGKYAHDIEGLVFKDKGTVLVNPGRGLVDVNQFPPLDYSLIDMERHFPDLEFGKRTIAYMSSQGCPHGCAFCAESLAYDKNWTGLSPRRVGEDLERLVRQYDADGFIFVDNNFFVDEERVKGICTEIIARGLQCKWAAQGRTETIARLSDATFSQLKKSGFTVFHTGAESGSDTQLARVAKMNDRQAAVSCAKRCREHGIRVSFGFIFGFPGETESDLQANFSLMEEVTDIQGVYDCIIHFYAPCPGAPLSREALRQGSRLPETLEGWITYNTVAGISPWTGPRYIDRVRRRNDFYYPLARPNQVFRERLSRRPRGRLFFRTLHLLAGIRYRLHFYAIPLEWRIFNICKWLLRKLGG